MPVSSRRTRVTLDQDRLIENGEPCRIDRIVVANSTGAGHTVNFERASSAGTVEFTIFVPANDTKGEEPPSIWDGGMKIKSVGDAGVIVTVFHSAPGT